MTNYLVTGGTGFIGRRLIARLLDRPNAHVHVLVRGHSVDRLTELRAHWPQSGHITPVLGDLTNPGLGVEHPEKLPRFDHVFHLGAVYDMTAPEERNRAANVDGTRHALAFAKLNNTRCFHHVSSIAVAGDHQGTFRESDFEVGQSFPSSYHATKFESERLVRGQTSVPYRVYRPAVVVGDSRTGEMDKIDGPYYLFPIFARLARLPAILPIAAPRVGVTSVVPVDYVASAIDHLAHLDDAAGTTYHLGARHPQSTTEVFNAFAKAAGAPRIRLGAPGPVNNAAARVLRNTSKRLARSGRHSRSSELLTTVLTEIGVPPEVVPHLFSNVRFDTKATRERLRGRGVVAPDLYTYAPALYAYWAANLDPDRARARHRDRLAGRTILITGASSGIGRATALRAARRGATVVLVARRADELEALRHTIEAEGGAAAAYPCDLTDGDAIEDLAKQVLHEHGAIDMLVNNAGRSIRRSVQLSTDRFHDYERTMALNYFAAVRLTLALLPAMIERRFGRIVNVTTQGLEGHPPRYSAYLASKAALEEFGRIAGRDLLADGISFTSVRMPLVATDMIAPSEAANRQIPRLAPEQAASLIVRALEKGGDTISVPAGQLLQFAQSIAPRTSLAVSHLASFQATPETAPEASDRLPQHDPLRSVTGAMTRLVWRAL
ncbi:SDR family oxidoreductase [Hoyosella sp. YIM 151337]|uniref:SDR family oxidoreductase n=1 Tax=Hoyosella sp. YIM 151337 TaxID=2992742 RepID=UPI0022362957|nr:SDR family oxidoreductase [Hoyosella sp. YIM 151337]MCW4353782.1 SDR family oxidoreductase [Hoyosella sp. YIM 151337]